MRLSIDEYAQRFNLPITTVHTKLRNKELDYSIDEGIVYILLSSTPEAVETSSIETILALYKNENQQLKEKVEHLEKKIDRLIDDKEQMLREERSRIEHLYQTKDEQLKTVLELINTKLQLSHVNRLESTPNSTLSSEETTTEETIELSTPLPTENSDINPHKIALRKYLKNIGLETNERRLVKRRFAGAYGSDIRVLQQGGEFYLDLGKFDYSDLLKIH